MECAVSLDSGEGTIFPGHSRMSIDFDDLKAKDKVVIRTRNSTYQFLVTDPAKKRVVLTGGALGNTVRDAVLIESFATVADATFDRSSELETGSRALFYLLSPRGAERLATSVIEELVVIRSEDETLRIG